MLGAERLVHGLIGGAGFTLRMPSSEAPPRVGDTLMQQPTVEHLHWFDSGTAHRVA